jgi:NAD(P)-dependent dehydrogenase (short-subunit alcohol dehydrogenase family)
MDRSIVLVTGASRGIGEATAGLLAERGYRVFGTARRPAADRVDGFEMLPLDVTSGESVKSCVSAVLERAGGIDVLVNNAGIGLIGAVEETPVEDAAALFDANLFGAARMVNAVLPGMRQRKSELIINFGSLAAGVPNAHFIKLGSGLGEVPYLKHFRWPVLGAHYALHALASAAHLGGCGRGGVGCGLQEAADGVSVRGRYLAGDRPDLGVVGGQVSRGAIEGLLGQLD